MSNIDNNLLADIPAFETFLHKVGFKRNEGAIFGLLVLSEDPLSSEEIEQKLNLSQSSVSMALKKLSHYGAAYTFESRDPEKRVKLHTVKEDSLAIVATLFKKREQETIEEFKKMTSSILEREKNPHGVRAKRLKSIVTTCIMAESIMNFVIKLASKSDVTRYEDVVKRIPQALDLMTQTIDPIGQLANQFKTNMTKKGILGHKLSEGMMKFVGESYDAKK
jgi:DNA-binding transcriptional regulator GbsR (MarR family)